MNVYTIDKIEKIRHDDGRTEVVPCDETVELLALELKNMDLSYPVSENDEGTISEHFENLDIEIGQVEADGIYPTRKYDDQTGMAVDEFNIEEENGYIDYDELNRRLKIVLDSIKAGTFEPYVKIKWRKGKPQE